MEANKTSWDETLLQTWEAAEKEQNEEEIEIDFRQGMRYLKTKIWKIIAVGAVFALLTAIWVLFIEAHSYEATEKLYVMGAGNSIVDLSDLQLGSSLASDYREVFRNTEIHDKIRQKLHLDYTNEQMDKIIDISNPAGTRILVVTATGNSEFEAIRLVEEYSEAARLFIEDRMGGKVPSIFEKATPVIYRRGLLIKSFIAGVLGVFVGLIFMVAYSLLVCPVFDRKMLEEQMDVSVLGAIPADRKNLRRGKGVRKAKKEG